MNAENKKICCCVFILLAITVHGTPETRQFDLGSGMILRMAVDPRWNCTPEGGDKGDNALHIVNPLNPKEKCRIYIIQRKEPLGNEELVSIMKMNGAALLQKAVEKEFAFQSLPGDKGRYYILTDRSPAPGESGLISRGAFSTNQHLILFTALFEQRDSPFFQELLRSLSTLTVSSGD